VSASSHPSYAPARPRAPRWPRQFRCFPCSRERRTGNRVTVHVAGTTHLILSGFEERLQVLLRRSGGAMLSRAPLPLLSPLPGRLPLAGAFRDGTDGRVIDAGKPRTAVAFVADSVPVGVQLVEVTDGRAVVRASEMPSCPYRDALNLICLPHRQRLALTTVETPLSFASQVSLSPVSTQLSVSERARVEVGPPLSPRELG
jgi:hypothetical protein